METHFSCAKGSSEHHASVDSYDLTAISQLLKDQIEQDEQICDLCGQMNKLYDRIHRLVDPAGQDGIGDIEKRQKEILSRVARQANNCAYFIVDYCKRSFGTFGQIIVACRVYP